MFTAMLLWTCEKKADNIQLHIEGPVLYIDKNRCQNPGQMYGIQSEKKRTASNNELDQQEESFESGSLALRSATSRADRRFGE